VIPPLGKCVWDCGSDSPFNEEHIIGRQFAKALGMPFPVPVSWGDIRRTTGEQIQHGEQLEDELGITLKHRVCERCNGKWMKRLDDLTARFMRPALRHEQRVRLNDKQQLTLSRWANKVGLLLAIWFHDQPKDARSHRKGRNYVPADNFARLYRSSGLPHRTRVWFGAVDPTLPIRECFVTTDSISTESGPVGYYTAFRLKRLLFVVSGLALGYDGPVEDWPNPQLLAGDRHSMTRLWPIRERVVEWPPPARLTTDDLDKIVKLQSTRG
jgi:hypothetical protein